MKKIGIILGFLALSSVCKPTNYVGTVSVPDKITVLGLTPVPAPVLCQVSVGTLDTAIAFGVSAVHEVSVVDSALLQIKKDPITVGNAVTKIDLIWNVLKPILLLIAGAFTWAHGHNAGKKSTQ
jgi:hypothetical protein